MYNIKKQRHVLEIRASYLEAIFTIKAVEQYAVIQNTKSYAALQWLCGQFLADHNEIQEAIRYLEDGRASFETLNILDSQYYQCLTLLGTLYLRFYKENRDGRIGYLRRARIISIKL